MTEHGVVNSLAWTEYPVTPQRPRARPMQVLCLGLSRTGTMSLLAALRILGYNPYHAGEALFDWKNGALAHWEKAMKAKLYGSGSLYRGDDFERMLWRYDAVSDVPACLFVDELRALYPDAKVILNTRDFESWRPSLVRLFYGILEWKRWWFLEIIDTQFSRPLMSITRLALEFWTNKDRKNKEKLREGFDQHHTHVRNAVPSKQLLEYKVTEGWAPLCKFLDKPIPDMPFPHINEGDAALRGYEYITMWRLRAALTIWFKRAAPLLVATIALWAYIHVK